MSGAMIERPTIPSLVDFKGRSDDEQKAAYRAGYKSYRLIVAQQADSWAEKRLRLLQAYQEAAGWSDDEVAQLQAQVTSS